MSTAVAVKDDVRVISRQVGSLFHFIFRLGVGALAFLGLAAIFDHQSWGAGLWAFISTRDASKALDKLEFFAKYGAIFWASCVAFRALSKADTILAIFRHFKDARAPIYEMAGTMTDVKSTAPFWINGPRICPQCIL